MIFNTKNLRRPPAGLVKLLLLMKLIVLLLTTTFLQVSARTFGQNVYLNQKNAKLATVLNEIRKQAGYDFVYSSKTIAKAKLVSVNLNNVSLEEALNACFKDQPLTYSIQNRIVTVENKKVSMISYMTGAVAATNLIGVVTDDEGLPLPGASVAIKGTNRKMTADKDGKFTFIDVPQGAVVIASFIGFDSKEVVWNGEAVLKIKLGSNVQGLDDVIVVAYGTAKKSTFTGSASVVNSEKLEKISGSGFAEALQGMSPGVSVSNNEGNPGGETRIQVRGVSSMSGSSNPLYVVDGMPYDGQLSSISPSDIESITVLKDAAASSLYGSRAANGVVMITTKRGKSGKPVINLRAAWGTSDNAIKNPVKADPYEQLLNTWEGMYNDQYYKYGMTKENAGNWASTNTLSKILRGVTNSAGEPTYVSPFAHINENYVLHDGNGNASINPNLKMVWDEKDYDYNDAVFGLKPREDYGIDVSGASNDGKTNYLFSSSYLNDGGYANRQYFKRYTFRANVTTQVTDWLQLGGNMAFSSSKQNVSGAARALVFTTSMSSPWLRNRDNTDWIYSEKTGKRMYDYGSYANNFFGIHTLNNGGDYWDNDNDEGFNNNTRQMISARYFAAVTLPFNIKFKSSIGIDNNAYKFLGYGSAIHGSGQMAPYGVSVMTSGGTATRSNTTTTSLTWNNVLNWEKKIGDHNFSALAGHEWYSFNEQYDYAYGEGIMQADQYELSSTTRNWSVDSYQHRYSLLSVFGKLDYNFKDKYYLSGSVRRDGSSRFHPDQRWGNFYSVGGSWRISNENFIKEQSWINNLALRASYGTTGNDKLVRRNADGSAGGQIYYGYQGVYAPDDLYGNAGLMPSALPTPNLKWESNKQFNVGVDFNILKNLYGSAEYYSRNSSDLLFYKDLPLSSQVGSAEGLNVNLGNIRNSGFEFSLGTDVIRNKNFTWKVDGNFSTLKNEITDLPGGAFTFGNRSATYKMEQGKSLYEFFMVKNAGVNPENGNMRYWIRDGENWKTTENFDAEVTTNDYQYVGSALPKAYGSLTNTFNYKGLDFSFMLYMSTGAKMFDYAYIERTALRGGVGVIQDLIGDRWKNPGDQSLFPKWSNDNYSNTRKGSDFYVFDNDFLRLRNVTLGYTLPKSFAEKLGMSSARIYVTGNNLLTFGAAKKRYSDPETGILGNNYNGNADTDSGIQGSRRIYMGGIQVSF